MSDLTTHDVLTAAKAYLMEHGWHQGRFGAPGGPHCLYGAIKEAGGIRLEAVPTDAVFDAYEALYGVVGGEVARWNDVPERTFDDIIAALDKAILATAPAETPVEEPVPT